MATSLKQLQPVNNTENLECALCLRFFKEPKILTCSHTFCKGCLEDLLECNRNIDVLMCPLCGEETSLPGGDVGKLQSNIAVRSLVEDVETQGQLDQNLTYLLHLAIQDGDTSTIKKLVSEGADLNVQSTDGQTCLDQAIIKLCYKSEKIMHDTDTLTEISDEFYKGELSPEKALVLYLLQNGAKSYVRDKTGNLPIQYAKGEVVKQMIVSRFPSSEEIQSYEESGKGIATLNMETAGTSQASADKSVEFEKTTEGVSDFLILEIAERIGDNTNLMKLAIKLGVEFEQAEKFKMMNRKSGVLSSEGTRIMLCTWRDDTPVKKQRATLEAALIDADLARIADEFSIMAGEKARKVPSFPMDIRSKPIRGSSDPHGDKEDLLSAAGFPRSPFTGESGTDIATLNMETAGTPQVSADKSESDQGTTEAEKNDYDDLQEKAQSDGMHRVEHGDHALDDSSATGKFGALGGKLSTKSHGFTLHIPPGALEEDEEISLTVLTDIPKDLTLKEDELLVSHGFQCYPSGLRFKKPAKLIIPHCALVTAPNKVQTILYSWNQSGTPKRLQYSSNITCSVQERWLEVSIGHFSGGFFALIWDWLFLKGILLSCMSFLPRVLPSCRKPILEVRFVKMPHDQNRNDVHALTGGRSYQQVKDEDDYVVFRRSTLEVSCQLGEKDPKTDAIQHNDMDLKPRQTKYFGLDLTDEADETSVTLKLIQSTTETIKFKTSFQGIDEMCTQQDTPTTSSVETPTDKSREQDFDDFLKTVAKKIHKDIEIDSLGKELGFEPAEITRYIETNEKYQTSRCMGTLSMLRDWRNRSTRSKEHQELKKALIAINHHRLADDLQNNDPAS